MRASAAASRIFVQYSCITADVAEDTGSRSGCPPSFALAIFTNAEAKLAAMHHLRARAPALCSVAATIPELDICESRIIGAPDPPAAPRQISRPAELQ